MKTRELENLGIPSGAPMDAVRQMIIKLSSNRTDRPKKSDLRKTVQDLSENPEKYSQDALWGHVAKMIIETRQCRSRFEDREKSAPWEQWGNDLDPESIKQIENACKLPISVAGALMPDAHVGYGLPIGGVLGTDNAVIPYAVGVDIACRMKMTVLDLPSNALTGQSDRLKNAIHSETRFGVGATFKKRREHKVMDENWSFSPIIRKLKDKAWDQLGTSGSGNHFVEFGTLTLEHAGLGLEAGTYIALLSHSGSRGAGNETATWYSKLAMDQHPELPHGLKQLAWLDLNSQAGQEYWKAMELMGNYAAANHFLIHKHIARYLGVDVLLDIENHHNFAWKEVHNGRELIIHRKGATPAGTGVIGIIPGSMAAPGYVVRGKGNILSLNSASHGAGRAVSRKKAKEQFNWYQARQILEREGITVISAGLDEVPMAYKDIHTVMNAQKDLVEIIARFDPKLVKMAPAGERPED